jgi:hypothetical protein
MLKSVQQSDLQARVGTTNVDKLVGYLVNTGEICLSKMGSVLVIKFVSFGGRVIRSFGKTFSDAVRSLSYQAWCLKRV